MQIIITKTDDEMEVNFESKTEDPTPELIFGMLMSALDGAVGNFVEKAELNEEGRAALCDDLNDMMGLLIQKYAPEDIEQFTLSDAAIIYAQDMIIKDAEAEGITFNEALDKFKKKAEEYVREVS